MNQTRPRFNYTGYGWEGSRYNNDLDIKDIAKKVRQYAKAKHPKCKFSVTIERYTGGQSMSIRLMSGPFEAILKKGQIDPHSNEFVPSTFSPGSCQLNQYTFKDEYDDFRLPMPGWNNGCQMSRKAWDIMQDVYNYAESFNFDDSDGMIDYFHTNFYLDLEIGKWDKPYQIT